MAARITPTHTMSATRAKAIVTAFLPGDKAIIARGRVLLPYAELSPADVVALVESAYAKAGVTIPWSFGTSTIETTMAVVRTYLPLQERVAAGSDDEAAAIVALTAIIRAPKAHGGTRENGTKAVTAALRSKTGASAVNALEVTAARVTAACNEARRARATGRVSDDEIVVSHGKHDVSAAVARVGDERAEKTNTKGARVAARADADGNLPDKRAPHSQGGTRKSALRDPLEQTDAHRADMAEAATVRTNASAPAMVNPATTLSVPALIRELVKRVTLDPAIVAAHDDAFMALARVWEDAATAVPAHATVAA